MLDQLLTSLGLPENAKRLYLRLLETGAQPARQIAENLNIPRPSVYDYLKTLVQNGLVIEQTVDGKKVFQIDDVRHLPQMVQQKISHLQQLQTDVKRMLPSLTKQVQTVEPRIKFYSGTTGIKQVLRDMLWYQDIETLTMWPMTDMVKILDSEYLVDLNSKRIRRHISIRGIWPRHKAVDFKHYPFLGVGKGHLRELRLAPPDMTWSMSYWLYADKVAFISSSKENFGFVVHSQEFMELLKAQFEVIWKNSTPIKPQPQYTDAFLKSL